MQSMITRGRLAFVLALAVSGFAVAAPTISRLTPPSELFASNNPNPPYISRLLPGQRFDLQATVRLDAGTTLKEFAFLVDGVATRPATATTSVLNLPRAKARGF